MSENKKITSSSRQDSEKRIEKAKRIIRDNLKTVSLATVSEKCGYASVESFSYAFKNITGQAFNHYVQDVRVRKAKKILQEMARNNQPLIADELTAQVGLKDNQAFRDLFKRKTGKTPYEFLKSQVSEEAAETAKPLHRGPLWVQEQSEELWKQTRKDIQKAIHRLRTANLEMDDVSAQALCDLLDMPKSRFHRAFRDVVGTGYKEYMDELRFARAMELLADFDMSAADLTKKIGLKKEATMRSLFRQFADRTPTQLRDDIYTGQIRAEIESYLNSWVKKLHKMGAVKGIPQRTKEKRMEHIEMLMRKNGFAEHVKEVLHMPFEMFLDKVREKVGWQSYESAVPGRSEPEVA